MKTLIALLVLGISTAWAGKNSEEMVVPFSQDGYKFELKLNKEKTRLDVLEKNGELPSNVQVHVKRANEAPLRVELHLVSLDKPPYAYEGQVLPFGGSNIASVFEIHFNVDGKKKMLQSKTEALSK